MIAAAPGAGNPRFWLALAALVAGAVAMRPLVTANTDISWLLTAGEKVLAGERLYRDVIETNPPMAVMAYLPGPAIGRLLHVRAETVIDALTFFAVAVSAAVSLRIARGTTARGLPGGGLFVLGAVAVLAILPMQAFGQREHLAVIALLPALAALAARAGGGAPPWGGVIAAGLGAAIALSFKPYFALGYGSGVVAAAVLARSPRVLLAPEHMLAAALLGIYVALTLLAYPDYLARIYPLVRDVYLPIKRPLGDILTSPAVTIWLAALLLAAVLRPKGNAAVVVIVLASTSFGFALAFVVQQKGWAYQSYPMIALALVALAAALAGQPAELLRPRRRGAAAACAAILFAGGALWMNAASDARALVAPVARLMPHPNLLVFSNEPSIGHPLVRSIQGTWVSGQQALWIGDFVAQLRRAGPIDPPTDARLTADAAEERARLLADIARTPPDVILVDNLLGHWSETIAADPELGMLLRGFRRIETVQQIDIFARGTPR